MKMEKLFWIHPHWREISDEHLACFALEEGAESSIIERKGREEIQVLLFQVGNVNNLIVNI